MGFEPGTGPLRGLYIDSECPSHGWISHTAIHEAAHSVAAIDNAIAIDRVFLLPQDKWIRLGPGWIPGAVETSVQPSEYVPVDPVGALRFAYAGSTAERGALHHAIKGGDRADVANWESGLGSLDENEALGGLSREQVREQTEQWCTDRWPAIRKVPAALMGIEERGGWHLALIGEARELTGSEVAALVAQ